MDTRSDGVPLNSMVHLAVVEVMVRESTLPYQTIYFSHYHGVLERALYWMGALDRLRGFVQAKD